MGEDGAAGDHVEDEVVARPRPCVILARVVNDMAGAQRAHEIELRIVVYTGHFGTIETCDLHGERAGAAARAVNQDLLPRSEIALQGWRARQPVEGQASATRQPFRSRSANR